MAQKNLGVLLQSYRTLVILIRTRVAFRRTSCIYRNRDLFELIHQPASIKKIPPQHTQTRHLAGWIAGGGGYMVASLRSY